MPPRLRTLLILGRVSNLPTVWSNCLAGWWLSGGGNFWKLPLLFCGVSFLYTGGMFLNDAFDVEFDRQRRASRPIPSGKISAQTVWIFGWTWLALGILCLLFLGKFTGALAVVLAACIVIYDAAHKAVNASPWLMGLCRFWVYVIAGAVGANGLNGNSVWCGLALAFYVVGLSYVARRESFRGAIPHWRRTIALSGWNYRLQTANGVTAVRAGNKFLGNEYDLDLTWAHSENVSVSAGVGDFQPGRNLILAAQNATGHASPARLGYADLSVKF